MQINYYKINPGGNITAIVTSTVKQDLRVTIAKNILQSDSEIEQVGFLRQPKNPQASARIEMMGGEFCGNATRCLAYLLWSRNNTRKFMLESSGYPDLITAKVLLNYSEILLSTKEFKKFTIDNYNLIEMPGITHLLIEEKLTKDQAFELLNRLKLFYRPAVGVICVVKNNDQLQIKPFVWVNATQTFYEETACASGSLAVAYYYASENMQDSSILQPSGYKLLVRLKDDNISIGGPVLSLEKRSLIFDQRI